MDDELYKLMCHCIDDLGAENCTILFGNDLMDLKPMLLIFMSQYNLRISIHLDEIIEALEKNGYDYVVNSVDNDVEKVIIQFRRKKDGE